MTTATTRQAIRRELYNRIPGLAFTGTAASITGSTITDTIAFQDSSLGNNHYRGYYIYRPDVAAASQVRKIVSHVNSTGVLTHGGATWADTTDLDYEIVGLLHPDEINNAIIRSLHRIYFETQTVLYGRVTDGDMDANNTTSWTDVLTPTKSKVTSAGNVLTGLRALRVLNADAALEGVQSVTMRGFPANSWVYVHAAMRADVGEGRLQLYDVTNSTALATVTCSEEAWSHLWLKYQLGSTTEEIAIRLLGTADLADIYWDHVACYVAEDRVLPAPSSLDDPWKFLKLREMRYTRSVSSQSNGGYDAAYSRSPQDWSQPSAFNLEPFHLETNPYQIQLHRPIPSNELWVQYKRPWSDTETLSTDASTTLCPLEMLYAYATQELAQVLVKRYPNDERWRMLMSEADAKVEAETSARPEVPLAPIRKEYYGYI